MRDHDEKELVKELRAIVRLGVKALTKYLEEKPPGTTLKGDLSMNDQLNTLDSVVVNLTDTDNVTGAAVVIDPGSVTVVLSDPTDSVVIDPSGAFITITAGANLAVGKTATVNATVGGVASGPVGGLVLTYDVIAAAPDATTLSGVFASETAPANLSPVALAALANAKAAKAAGAVSSAPFTVGGAGDPNYRFNAATGTYDHV
jgi:hypothetical protein